MRCALTSLIAWEEVWITALAQPRIHTATRRCNFSSLLLFRLTAASPPPHPGQRLDELMRLARDASMAQSMSRDTVLSCCSACHLAPPRRVVPVCGCLSSAAYPLLPALCCLSFAVCPLLPALCCLSFAAYPLLPDLCRTLPVTFGRACTCTCMVATGTYLPIWNAPIRSLGPTGGQQHCTIGSTSRTRRSPILAWRPGCPRP